MNKIKPLGHDIFQIELVSEESIYRTSGYIIRGSEKIIIIETGSSRSNKAIHYALAELMIKPEQVDFIAVTHIHLDHSGGAGLLMTQCPNARLLVHKNGMKHITNPDVLIKGAKEVYGSKFETLFHPIIPIDPERIDVMMNDDECDIGNSRVLRFVDTQGHAFHHFVIFDQMSQGIFSGDSAGLYFKRIYETHGVPFCIPATVPTQFMPDLLDHTISKMIALNPDRIYFAHYGMSEMAKQILEQSRRWVSFFGSDCVQRYKTERSEEKLVAFAQDAIHKELSRLGVPSDFADKPHLLEDIKLNIQGVIVYFSKLERDGKI